MVIGSGGGDGEGGGGGGAQVMGREGWEVVLGRGGFAVLSCVHPHLS